MPPHRRNRWIVGALIMPPLMAGFSYAYNLKTEEKGSRLISALVFAFMLIFVSLLITGGLIDVMGLDVSDGVFLSYVGPPGYYLFSWVAISHYWKKLPGDFKRPG